MKVRSMSRRSWVFVIGMTGIWASLAIAQAPDAGGVAPGAGTAATRGDQQQGTGVQIAALFRGDQALNGPSASAQGALPTIGLNGELRVQLAPIPPPAANAQHYVLFFNGREVKGLPSPLFDQQRRLVFELIRNDKNSDLWATLLGSPTHWTVPVVVSLGERADTGAETAASIFGSAGTDTFSLEVLPLWRLVIAVVIVACVIAWLWGRSRRDPTLRDNMLPQLEPSRQTYSLARWQMGFWFTLIFAAFIVLFLLLWDANTISAQALTLMGISAATALAAAGVDKWKDSPADAVNRGLQALGLNSYDDVLRVRAEIRQRQQELTAAPPPTAIRAAQLQSEIQDRDNILRMYEGMVRPFVTQGWFRDLTTDLNGTAIHRLQVFCWTWVLGGVFAFEVWRSLAMPEFNANLLALMGISSAGYVGFKMPEANS